MAVKYVDDFSFAPSPPRPTIRGYARGGHVKASTPQRFASGGLAKGSGISNDSGHTGGNGPDAFKKRAQGDGNVKYYAKGGLAKGKGQSNDDGHTGKGGPDNVATKGAGDGDVKRSGVSPDIKKTVGEKSSGVQGPAFKKGGGIKLSGKFDGKSNAIGQGGRAAQLKAKGVPGGVIGNLARKAQAAPGQANYHAKGGRACMAKGGAVKSGKVKVVDSGAVNPNDAVSPGSFKKTPPGQSATNAKAAKSTFSNQGRNTPVATKQSGNVERMSGFSDFKSGGSVKHDRIKNLGHYAHGGKVKGSTTERGAGSASSGAVKSTVKQANAGKMESRAGTPKTSPGTRVEMKGGTAKAAMGGLSRGSSSKKNAAIHAKNHKPKASKGPSPLGALAGAMAPQGPMGPPPGGAPPMGAPPGPPMGGPPPGGPPGQPPMMSTGGSVQHVVHHHVMH